MKKKLKFRLLKYIFDKQFYFKLLLKNMYYIIILNKKIKIFFSKILFFI